MTVFLLASTALRGPEEWVLDAPKLQGTRLWAKTSTWTPGSTPRARLWEAFTEGEGLATRGRHSLNHITDWREMGCIWKTLLSVRLGEGERTVTLLEIVLLSYQKAANISNEAMRSPGYKHGQPNLPIFTNPMEPSKPNSKASLFEASSSLSYWKHGFLFRIPLALCTVSGLCLSLCYDYLCTFLASHT